MLDRLTIERLAGDGPIVLALSGGGDSVALLHLLVEHFSAVRLRAVVVDHALRAGSDDHADRARDIAANLGVAAAIKTLVWRGGKKAAQGAARTARYQALAAEAHALGARVILAAHTRDDQAETVLLRASRGSSWRGLAGMRAFAPAPTWPEGRGLWLARPLLRTRRSALRAMLREKAAAWIEDPANANQAFARVRARRWLEDAERAGFDPMRLARMAERLAPHASAQDAAAARLIQDAASITGETLIVAMDRWCGPNSIRERALSALITAAGGQDREPPPEQVATLNAGIAASGFKAATLAGVLLERTTDQLAVRRDSGALTGRADGAQPLPSLPLAPRQSAIWDNRLEVRVDDPGWSVVSAAGPILARGGELRPLAANEARWLIRERVLHVLGQVPASRAAPFTRP